MSESVLIILAMVVPYIGQAVLAGYLATKRGHVFWLWFMVALLIIFPFGFIITFIYAKKGDDSMP